MSDNTSKQKQLSPAQLKLLELLNSNNCADYARYLKEVHELGTYFVSSPDLVDLSASLHVHHLFDAIFDLALENDPTLKITSHA